MIDETRVLAAISSAFPAVRLERALFDDPTGLWSVYVDAEFEADVYDRTWSAIELATIEKYSGALRYVSPAGFVALLPAYLRALCMQTQNELPALVLGQLTRSQENEAKLAARVELLTSQQRDVVRLVIDVLAQTERYQRYYASEIDAARATWH